MHIVAGIYRRRGPLISGKPWQRFALRAYFQPTISCNLYYTNSRPNFSASRIEKCNFIALTLESDIHIGAVCCFSIRSVTLLYQLSACKGKVEVSTCPHSFSIFWHCSNNFLLLRWAFLGTKVLKRWHTDGGKVQAVRKEERPN